MSLSTTGLSNVTKKSPKKKSSKKKNVMINTRQDEDSWRDFVTIERHRHLLKSGYMSDCKFIVGEDTDTQTATEIHCHKFILSNASPVFEVMFYGVLAEKKEVKVKEVHPKAFLKMLEFLYTDDVDLECIDMALGVYYAAHKYLIYSLSSKCHQFIMQTSLEPQDVCKMLEFSRLVSNNELKDVSMKSLCHSTEDILATDSFIDAELATLQSLLEQDKLDVPSEVTLFSACLRWAEPRVTEQTSLRQVLDPVLPLIRFKIMTSKEFAEIVCNSKVLTEKEERDIFICLASEASKMPHNFSNENKIRENFYGEKKIINLTQNIYNTTDVNTPVTNSFFRGVRLKRRQTGDYDENVKMDYYNENNELTASVTFKGRVTTNDHVDVLFKKPFPAFVLQSNNDIHPPRIIVTYSNTNNRVITRFKHYFSSYMPAISFSVRLSGESSVISYHLSRK